MCPRTTHFHKRLGFETLETRELLSGVTAALSRGVLAVSGASDSSAAIHVWRQGNRIRVDGVAGSFTAAQVKSIVVTCGASGDQTVTLGFNQTRTQTALARPVTVISGSGDEAVRLAATNVYFAGAGHRLTVNAGGAALLDGAKPTWFDTHLVDAAIRSMAKSLVRNNVLSRNAMLAIFNEVAAQGAVSSIELGDLQSIANDAALFSSVAYVQNLTDKVVLGNVANASYLGTTLGNLVAGASAIHLDDLVDKWFLGTDHPNATVNNVTYVYAQAKGTLFPYVPLYTDVRQGNVGDCYLLAGLAGIAANNPSAIQSMFIVNGDGTYTVRFYNGRQADYVTVDSYLPEDDDGKYAFANQGQLLSNEKVALWAALAEKAYAEINEEGWLRKNGSNSYASLNLGWPNNVYTQVTASPAVGNLSLDNAGDFNRFVDAYESGKLLWLVSNAETVNPLVGTNHVYVVVGYNAKTREVLMYNPWGIDNGTAKPGLLSLSWDQVVDNFRAWCRS